MNMKKILLLFLSVLLSISAFSETKTAAGSGYWDAITWSPAGEPQSGDDVVIPDGVTVIINDAAKTVRSINIQNDGANNNPGTLKNNQLLTVTGASSTNSTVSGKLEVNNTLVFTESDLTVGSNGIITIFAGKQLIFASSSSSITNNGGITLNSSSSEFSSVIYTGNSTVEVTYKRSISGVSTAWDLIGSPVSGETASDIVAQTAIANSGSDFGIGEYNNQPGNDNTSGYGSWTTFSSDDATFHGTLSSGKGYQMATDGSENSEIDFTGSLHTSTVSVAITEGDSDGDAASVAGTRFNLFANPFAAYASVNSNASSAATYGTTHLLSVTNLAKMHANNQAVYVWNGSAYTTIGTSTAAASAVIAPGQGFMIGGKYDDGSVNFAMPLSAMTEDGTDDAISGDIMYDENRAELFIGLSQNDIDRHTEIYFLEDGSDNFTSADAGGFELNYNSIFTRVVSGENDVDLAIQTLAYSEMWEKVIPVGVDALGGEEMTIGISHRTTPADLNIYLEDTEEGTMTNLLESDFVYTPTSDLEGVGRFFIHMTADTMSNEDVSTSMLNAYKEIDASYITIEGLATQTNETNVSLYNILGRKVLSTTLNNNMNTQTISTIGLSAGIYVIELESGTDRLTKKLIIK
jgi:hypothetical protein